MKKLYNEIAFKSGVYKITNILNDYFYFGSCKCFKVRCSEHERLLRKGKHHSQKLQNAWNKYKEEAFMFEALEIVDGDKLQRTTVEQKYLDEIKDWEQCYNIKKDAIQKQGPWSNTPEETREKLQRANFGKKHTKETKKKISEANRGRPSSQKGKFHTDETKRKISKANKGRKQSEEAKRKISEMQKGHIMSEETKQKISKANKGKSWGNHTEEAKQRISEATKGKNNPFYNKKHTDKVKRKISESKKGKKRKPISETTKMSKTQKNV